ncbi:MAG: LTA synthase family protein [Candidatus Gracilibacteria bacterium]|nr:LTA synthase family protein [Candidatus Gracilibacteria bacterium]MDD3120568.1 LTA synthase family protein [Candidatus Gracilibacteria bacterium]MDD4530371.1 LTA synthase family protein [Candidatus Gracilibacteria bacterium]
MLKFVKIGFDAVFIELIIFAFVVCLAYFFLFKGIKINKKLRIGLGLFLVLINGYIIFNNDFRVHKLQYLTGLNAEGLSRRQQYNYDHNGFIAGFFVNIGNVNIKKPANYNEKTINELVQKYSKVGNNSEIKKPNVIFILSESFWDITQLPNVSFSSNPIINFNEIKKNSTTGNFISPTFGGKTALVEFEILTGNSIKYLPFGSIPYQQYIKKPVLSVVQEFRKNGYQTLALHTFEKIFFNRVGAYPFLGFDKFIGIEDLKNPKYKGPFVSDEEFTDQVINNFKNKDLTKPLFLLGITMQNHFTYEGEKYKNLEIKTTGTGISAKSINILNNYSQGIMDADKQLGRLIKFLKEQKEPTIVVFFGDHLGSMGENYLTYKETGFISPKENNNGADEENKKMYSTEFLIWNNYSQKQENKNIGNIGATYFGNYLLDYIGFQNKNPYYNYLSDEYNNCVQANSEQILLDKNGSFVLDISTLGDNCKDIDNIHNLFQYDILFGGNFNGKW